MKKYRQDVLIGRNKRPAILETCVKDDCITFTVIQKNKIVATRSTSKTQDEQTAIRRLAKAVSGLAYVFVVPVVQEPNKIKDRYFKVNN